MGVITIWGPDYHGGFGDIKFNEKNNQYGRFYACQKARGQWKIKPLEQVYFKDKEKIGIDCGVGAYYILQKAGLYNNYAGMADKETALKKVDKKHGGKVITNKKDLQVGDIFQISRTKDESGWFSVCIIGEVHPDGTFITYDTGSNYASTSNFRRKLTINDDGTLGGDYKGYKSWFAVRIRALDQSDAKITK